MIWRLLTGRERRLLALATLLWLLWSLVGAGIIVAALLMVQAIMNMKPGAPPQVIHLYWWLIIGAFIVKGGCLALASVFSHLAGSALIGRLRQELTARLKAFSLGFFTRERLGDVSTIVHHDIDRLEALISHLWTRLISDLIVSAALAAFLFAIDWRLGLALVSLLPPAFFILWRGRIRGTSLQRQNRDNMSGMASAFVEFTRGIPVLKSFSENPAIQEQLQQKITAFGQSSRRAAREAMYSIGGYNLLMELCFGVLSTAAAFMIIGRSISLTVYLLFILLGREFYKPLANAEVYWINYLQVRDSYRRIGTLLEHPVIPEPARPEIPGSYGIRFDGVRFRYERDGFALDNVDFEIGEHTVTALVGPSGSGKTTIANLLVRFWDVESGAIRIGGVDIRSIPYDDLLGLISIVMQDVLLFNDTISENIRVGKKAATGGEIVEAARQAMLHDFIMTLPEGYETPIDEQGARLSGGERQRLAIARAILKNAPIVILDEATSAIDPINERQIQNALGNLVQGKTVLVVAHHLQTIRHAEQIIVMDRGHIAERGTHDELLAGDGLYSSLWEAQTQARGWRFSSVL